MLRQLEHAASVAATSSDDDGEFFNLLAAVQPAGEVVAGSIIVVPLKVPAEGEPLDFTFVASSKAMFVTVFETPQVRNTYGHVASYSTGTEDRPFPVGTLIKFATPPQFIVAKCRLVHAIRTAGGAEVELPTDYSNPAVGKRPRHLVSGGELVEDAVDKPKGTYLLDLDDVRHFTRNKSDLALRERELNFIFRSMDVRRRDYVVSTDLILQTEIYRSMLNEQGDTHPGDRHEAFVSCGILSRVPLLLFQKKEKLKSLLTGFVLVECSTELTLSLDDFTNGEKISGKASACSSNNVGIIQALKNLQTVMQIVFSDVLATSLEVFIDLLEGVQRPMDVVAADFLRYSVELTLRKFFRIIRSVRGTALADYSVKTPELCATLLAGLFKKLADDLTDPATLLGLDTYYRVRVSHRKETEASNNCTTPAKSGRANAEKHVVTFAQTPMKPAEEVKAPPSKPCSGHLGGLLSAVRKDGRAYVCNHGKDCSYKHISLVGKSNQRLQDIIAAMPIAVRDDLKKAVDNRK